ncbi:MAG: hypothetical protein LLF99_06840 [Desulfobacteraceae bacterium]|nr:hypothetical protein [Desulfobacteraceae bacterium]
MRRKRGKRKEIDRNLVVLTDGLLDHLAERFHARESELRGVLRVTFARYVDHPEEFDRLAQKLRGGCALQGDEKSLCLTVVSPGLGPVAFVPRPLGIG